VVQAVRQDTRAIGYGDTVMVKGVKVLPVGKGGITDTYYADVRSVALGLYPLSRRILFLTVGDAKGLAQNFEGWVQGSAAGKISVHAGFFPYVQPRGPVTDDTLDQETMGHPSRLW
jgi:ABC-type phosphate transport system substrate-binding protein